MPWVSGKRHFSRALMVTLATWARILTWKQVAKLFLITDEAQLLSL
jgi:hypothetical protein